MAGPANTPNQPIRVEYDGRNGKRQLSKPFVDHYAARRYYAAKLKQGRNPKVVKDDYEPVH